MVQPHMQVPVLELCALRPSAKSFKFSNAKTKQCTLFRDQLYANIKFESTFLDSKVLSGHQRNLSEPLRSEINSQCSQSVTAKEI